MADLSLPSPTELEKAATNDPSSPDTQALLLRVLVYGTTAHESLSERAKASAKVLTDLWEDVPAIEDSLVDSLWLIGSSVLEEEDTTAAAAGEDDLPKDADMDVDDTAMSSNKSFVEIVKSLIQVPDRQSFWEKLQANLLPSILDASGLASETELLKKIKMQNTQAYYKQQKFSLLQEESEGYAKVLQFLMEASVTGAEDRRKQLMSIIGTFELDPSRVLDLSIDILQSKLYPIDSTGISSAQPETNEQVEWMLGTIKELPTTRIPSLLYFKLSPSSTTENSSSSSDNRLLNTAVFLAIQGLYDLQVLYADFFATTEESIEEVHSVYSSRERRRVQGLGRVSLSGTTKEDPKLVELNQQVNEKLEPLEASSSIRMLLTLLEWGYWERVKPLISKEAWSQLCRIFPNSFGAVLCDATMERIKPWCDAKLSHLPTLMNAPSFDDSPMETDAFDDLTLDEVVEAVSDTLTCTLKACSIGSRPKLFCQLCRLFSSLMGPEDSEYELSDDSYYFFKTILVPSISLFPSNSAVSSELWSVLERLPYVTRYRLYEDWKGPGLEKAGLSLSSTKPIGYVESEMIAGKDCRYALKRLSKENIRDMSRQLAKVTHSNPMVVFATILGQIESYDNMVEVMVEATRFVNPLGLDVLGYCILSRLSGMTGGVNRNRLKGMNVSVSRLYSCSFLQVFEI
jgi:THO complex subunit 2